MRTMKTLGMIMAAVLGSAIATLAFARAPEAALPATAPVEAGAVVEDVHRLVAMADATMAACRSVRFEARAEGIGALGVRVKRWVSFHGISLNVDCDLSHFAGIVPCGIAAPSYGVTSLSDLGQLVSMPEVDMALEAAFFETFGA
jgi:lipoate-protein ligase B